jgi:hypothetical protein
MSAAGSPDFHRRTTLQLRILPGRWAYRAANTRKSFSGNIKTSKTSRIFNLNTKLALKSLRSAAVVLAIAAYMASALLAQGAGTLRGEVRDATAGVIPGAKVIATHQPTAVSLDTVTTATGSFQFPNLLIGPYTLSVEAQGFKTYVQKDIQLLANQVTDVNPLLELGDLALTVEVRAGGDLVSTTTSQLGGSVQQNIVLDLPNPALSGNPLNLAVLFPNTTTQGGGMLGEGGSIGGNRTRNNSFTIDGVDNNGLLNTGAVTSVIQDAIAEFNLLTNQFSAEFGHSAGGQFNILTQSGSNQWHGNAFYFGQNRHLNALGNLTKAAIRRGDITRKPRYDFNRGGGTLGGPLLRDRLFVFGAYQYQTQGRNATGVSVLAPTSEGLSTLNSMTPNAQVREILSHFPAASNATRNVLVNSQNIPVGTFQAFAPGYFTLHSYQINTDANFGSHQLRGRFLADRLRSPLSGDLPVAEFTGTTFNDNHKVAIADIWIVSPTLVNDFRTSYSRSKTGLATPPEFANFPTVILDDLGLIIGPNRNAPQSSIQNVYQWFDNVSYSRGRHQWKSGAEFRAWIAPTQFLPFPRGQWDYRRLNSLVNDLVPDGANGAQRGAGLGVFAGNQRATYGFVQDDVKLTSNLMLNLGLRYEWTSNPRDAKLQELNAISTIPGLFEFRNPKTDKNNFAPRVGFAYAPGVSQGWLRKILGEPGKSSVRGGFGVAYDVSFQNLVLSRLPPQLQSQQTPELSCQAANRPAWCAAQAGFLAGGGLLQIHVPPATVAQARAATSGYIVDQVQPKVLTWSLSLQREFAGNYEVELRYLGTRGLSLPIQIRENAITVFEKNPALALPTYFNRSDVPASVSVNAPSRAAFLAARGARFEEFGASPMTTYPTAGNSSYHAGSVELNRRFHRGLFVKSSYTWSRTLDNSTNEFSSSVVNPRRPQDPYNLRNEWGLSALDRPHKFVLAWVWDLPRWHGENSFVKSALGGWQLNGTYLAESGQPITAQSGVDSNGDRDAIADRALLNPNGTAMVGSGVDFVVRNPATGATSISSTNPGNSQVVGYVARNASARFVVAEAGTVPTLGRNTIRTPGLNNTNLSVLKKFNVSDSKRMEFRLELFNAFNHRQPGLGSGTTEQSTSNALSATYANVSSPNFLNAGQFSGGSRTVQYGLKLFF